MVRWDSPLFTVMWSDENMPYEDIWNAITRGNVKPPNAGTVAVRLIVLLSQNSSIDDYLRQQGRQQMLCTHWRIRRPV